MAVIQCSEPPLPDSGTYALHAILVLDRRLVVGLHFALYKLHRRENLRRGMAGISRSASWAGRTSARAEGVQRPWERERRKGIGPLPHTGRKTCRTKAFAQRADFQGLC